MAAIGIDFGYSTTRVAILNQNGSEIKVDVIEDESGNHSAPTIIVFNGEMRLIGEKAANQAILSPENVIYGIKRIVGRQIFDDLLIKHLKTFHINAALEENIRIKLHDGLECSVEELVATIFSKIKESVEKIIEQQVTKAVITVPSYFTHTQRQALINAASIAEIEVLRLVNDCTAAAANYVYEKSVNCNEKYEHKKVLFFDCGGGSLDVSLIEINNLDIRVLSTSGSTSLGGAEFDDCLLYYFINKLESKGVNVKDNIKILHELRNQCENVKTELQGKKDAIITIRTEFYNLSVGISIDKFEEISADIFGKIFACADKCIRDSDFGIRDVHEVVLLGGISRFSKIDEHFVNIYSESKVKKGEEFGVKGAAIMCGKLSNAVPNKFLSEISISDITPFNIGLTPKPTRIPTNDYFPTISVVIGRNTSLISERSAFLCVETLNDSDTNEAYADIGVVVGDSSLLRFYTALTVRFFFDSSGSVYLEVKFSVNENGIYDVKAVTANDKKQLSSVIIYGEMNITEEKENLNKYKINEKNVTHEMNSLEEDISDLREEYRKHCQNLLDEDKSKLAKDIECIEEWIKSNSELRAAVIQRKRSEANNTKQHIHEYLKKADVQKTQIIEDLKTKIEYLESVITENECYLHVNDVDDLISSLVSVSGWLLSDELKPIVELCSKLRIVNEVDTKINILVVKEKEEFEKITSEVLGMRHSSPFEKFKSTSIFEECSQELMNKITAFERYVAISKVKPVLVIKRNIKAIDDFVQQKIGLMTNELSNRTMLKQEVEQYKESLEKLLKQPNFSMIAMSEQEMINEKLQQTLSLLEECEVMSISDIDAKVTSIKDSCDSIIKCTNKEIEERCESMRKLENLLNTVQKHFNDNESKISESIKNDALRKITVIKSWLELNTNTTKEKFDQKFNSLNLIRNDFQSKVKQAEETMAARNKLFNYIFDFWKSDEMQSIKAKLSEASVMEIDTSINSKSRFLENNVNATNEEIDKLIQEINELKKTAKDKAKWVNKLTNWYESLKASNKSIQSDKEVKHNTTCVGIDLGTSNCCISLFVNGNVECIPQEDLSRSPSYVAFTEDGIAVGKKAKEYFEISPKDTFYNIKRLLGKKFADLKNEIKQLPFQIIESEEMPRIVVETKTEKKLLSPEELCALILIKLKKCCETYLKQEVTVVSITVPSVFNCVQRKATVDAAHIAGFKTIKLINDTTAISLYHYWQMVREATPVKRKVQRHLLIVSMGSGYVCVSVVQFSEVCIRMLFHTGVDFGGNAFDHKIFNHFLNRFGNQKYSNEDYSNYLLVCEKAKIALSSSASVRMSLKNVKFPEMTKTEFQCISKDIFESIFNCIRSAITFAKSSGVKIYNAAVAGRTSEIPGIRHFLDKELNLNVKYYTDTCLSFGASLYSAFHANEVLISKNLHDITSYRYTVSCRNNKEIMMYSRADIPVVEQRNIRVSYGGNHQYSIELREADTIEEKIIAKYSLYPLHKVGIGNDVLQLILKVDENGIVDLTAIDLSSQKIHSIELDSHLSRVDLLKIINGIGSLKNDIILDNRAMSSKCFLIKKINSWEYSQQRSGRCLSAKEQRELSAILLDTCKWCESERTETEFEEKQSEVEHRLQSLIRFRV